MKRWTVIVVLALAISLIHQQIFFSRWGERIEPFIMDFWYGLRGPVPAPPDVVLISMDESSYRVLDLPLDKSWPRAMHAQLLRRLKEYGVKRVVMDILFLGESSDRKADKALAEAFKLSPTVIGADSGSREQATAGGTFVLEELLEPPEDFSKNVEAVALARLPDDFGYVRRFIADRTSATRDIPSLWEAALGKDFKGPRPSERDFIWHYGPAGAITTFPYHQVLNDKGALPKHTLEDKIVFVGLNLRTEVGPAQKDSYRTPFYKRGSVFGVEIQATATANLLSGKWTKRFSPWTEGVTLFLVSFCLISAIFHLKPHWAGIVLAAYVSFWAICSYSAFYMGYFVPGAILAAIILPISYLASTLAYYLITHRSQQQVEKAFQMYLSPDMAKQMRDDPQGLRLGGENMFATALFTDIENFTAITEGMVASDVAHMLNSYFSEVMDEIFHNKGTLIKFIGDAVFALWGAPIKIGDHARLACETAITMQAASRKFNETKRFPALITRVGINTGPMVVGNLGSVKRFDYTAIGDSVNLASRLEGLNKPFGTSIIISEATKKEAGGTLNIVSLGNIIASGKSESVGIYALFENTVSAVIAQDWLKALSKFRLRQWDEAQALFLKTAGSEERLKKASSLYLAKIDDYKKTPPADNWEGEIEFTTK